MFLNTVKRIRLRQEELQGQNLLVLLESKCGWRLGCDEDGMISVLMDWILSKHAARFPIIQNIPACDMEFEWLVSQASLACLEGFRCPLVLAGV